jgi:diacylglycerol kinase family enzyme
MTPADIEVLVNARSGDAARDRVARLEAAAAPWRGRIAVRPVPEPGLLAETARDAAGRGARTVAAAGGDGTVNAVARGLLGTGARLGVVPLGTFNYFARGLGLPETPEGAMRVLAERGERAIDLGEVNGEVFLNNASLGVYPEILREREAIYRRFGRSRLAAHWSVARTLVGARAPLSLTLRSGGETRRFTTPLLFVALNPYQLDLFSLEGRGCLEDGRLALYAAPDRDRATLIGLAGRLALGRLRPREHFTLFCADDVTVESAKHEQTLAFDGERTRHASPFRFRLLHRALAAAVPAGRAGA